MDTCAWDKLKPGLNKTVYNAIKVMYTLHNLQILQKEKEKMQQEYMKVRAKTFMTHVV